MIKLKTILNEEANTPSDLKKILKRTLKAEQDYLQAIAELKKEANAFAVHNRKSPYYDDAISVVIRMRDTVLYNAERNRIGGNNARHGDIVDKINKIK